MKYIILITLLSFTACKTPSTVSATPNRTGTTSGSITTVEHEQDSRTIARDTPAIRTDTLPAKNDNPQ